ncbi:major facilitator superfamily transporter [Diaporthe helianthi]|uniref:Major facilitator superfamily transporter n=1 Tax=Diaporthe helianthi TaxID=158607 RepID=A0A2P5HN94_DIAHE|nr:major facilitator superfamily transporter [Diaporthe helianthi]
MIGMAGLFSGLSSNIYFPSLDAISRDLNVSLEAVSLTITSYLIIQGISPLFWGPLSDTIGRRPVYIASFSVYIVANFILSFSPNFSVFLIARGLQSAGSASTVSIVRNFSIAIGPVLGGLLANFLGFRSIFVFLTILSGLVLVILLVYLPETLRRIAGNGTLRLSGVYQPFIRRFTKDPEYMEDPGGRPEVPKVTLKTFAAPIKLLAEKDIIALLVSGGMVYTIWSMLVASTTGIFKERFGLNELMLGFAFLPNGFGTIVGSYVAGKIMARDFVRFEQLYLETHPGAPAPSKSKKAFASDFPIEHARLRSIPWITLIFVVSTATYGFTVLPVDQLPPQAANPAWIALPLFLQFLIAATSNAVFAINTTLVSDLCPGKGASSTAVNNLVRCSMGAVGVGVVESMLAHVGRAGTFVALALLVVAMSAIYAVEWYWGMQWRQQREMKKNALDTEKV